MARELSQPLVNLAETDDFAAITALLTAITMLAFIESRLFVSAVSAGLGLDLAVYMQPLDYVIITPSWLWFVLFMLPTMISSTFFDVFAIAYVGHTPSIPDAMPNRVRVVDQIEEIKKYYIDKLHQLLEVRNRDVLRRTFYAALAVLFWIGFAIFIFLAMHKTSRFLPIRPTPAWLIPWHFWAGLGLPALSVRPFLWLFRKCDLPLHVPYKNLLLALLASLWIAALTYGYYYFAFEARKSVASTRIYLKTESSEQSQRSSDRIVRGTILFTLTDRLLVLSEISKAKPKSPRSIVVVPLTEVRLIEATQ